MPARTRKSQAIIENPAEPVDGFAEMEAADAAAGVLTTQDPQPGDATDGTDEDNAPADAAEVVAANAVTTSTVADDGTETPNDTADEGKAKRNRNKVIMIIPVDLLGDAEDVPESEWAAAPVIAADERNPAQLLIDADVLDIHKQWVAAGKPAPSKSPRKRRIALPEHAPAIRHMIGLAAKLHGVSAVISPATHNADGKEIIVFTARDIVKRDRKADGEIQAVREWAKAQGLEISERGRIPEDIREKYDAAQATDEAKAEADRMAKEQADGADAALAALDNDEDDDNRADDED